MNFCDVKLEMEMAMSTLGIPKLNNIREGGFPIPIGFLEMPSNFISNGV